MNKAKQEAGKLGGSKTYQRYGRNHMQEIGRRGAETTWRRYYLHPVDVSGWALIHRETGQVKAVWG